MSFTSQAELRAQITDVRALRALAHPLRLALLNHLMAFGAQTASQCAEVVGSTASNCSYHLRALARFGLVESVVPVDGRERPWKSVATGLEFGVHDGAGQPDVDGARRDPEPPRAAPGKLVAGTDTPQKDAALGMKAAERVLADAQLDDGRRLARRALDRRDGLPAEWRESIALSSYALRMTASELTELEAQLDALIRPYISLTRADPPEGSEVVFLSLEAFLHPDGRP